LNRFNWFLFAGFTLFIILVIVLAYTNLIPREIDRIPYYDELGHYILYGTWGFLCSKIFSKPLIRKKFFIITYGICIVLCIALIEEFFQLLSPVRTFSLVDLLLGVLGIGVAAILDNVLAKRLSSYTERG